MRLSSKKGTKYRAGQMPPLLFSPHDPHTLYFGTQYVMKTTDDGKTWEEISPDLTEWKKPDEEKPTPESSRPPAIEALAISPHDAGESSGCQPPIGLCNSRATAARIGKR